MPDVVIAGAAGRMGSRLVALLQEERGLRLVGALEAPGHPALQKDAGEVAGIGRVNVPITGDPDGVGLVQISLTGSMTAIFDAKRPRPIVPRLVHLAQAAGVGRPYLSRIETSKVLPSDNVLTKIATALNDKSDI